MSSWHFYEKELDQLHKTILEKQVQQTDPHGEERRKNEKNNSL